MTVRRRPVAAASLFLLAILITLHPIRPAVAKYASLVIDARTGTVLEELNADGRNYPASLTKMMTLYLTFEALESGRLQKSQRLRASHHASIQAPSKLDLAVGDTITVEQAILALTVKSANDAAVVLAEAIGGTEPGFAQMMTQKARQIGMRSTVFRNASGLPNSAQVTTARDLAVLAQALLRNFPQYYHYFGAREFTFQGTTIPTHNHVLTQYDGADGFKTGFIHASGFNLVTSAVRDGHRLIGVVLGGQTGAQRDHAMMRLLDLGFAKDIPIREARAPAGAQLTQTPDTASEPAITEAPPLLAPAIATIDDAGGEGSQPRANWGIQIGAYGKLALAQQAAQKIHDAMPALGKTVIAVGHTKIGSTTIYRARLLGLSENQAHVACAYIHRHKGACLLVSPDGGRTVAQISQ